jgi:NAD(P)-dependent dehydrogenase (short-subunit alcohol dehydrogenase family)/SAM-dependent methyltransferase
VTGSEVVRPEAATLRGLVQVVPQEHPGLRCRGLDVAPRAGEEPSAVASTIVSALGLALEQPIVAQRGRQLWVPDHQELPRPPESAGLLRHGGVYLITGGTGAIGRAIARHLATKYNAKIALLSRRGAEPSTIDNAAGFAPFVETLASYETEWRRENDWHDQDANAPLKRALDRIAAAYVRDLLRAQGVDLLPGQDIDRAQLIRSLAIAPASRRMFESMLDALEAEGSHLSRDTTARAMAADLVAQHPTLATLFDFLGSCVESYPDVLTGKRPGIEVLYPVGNPQALNDAMAGMAPFSQYEVYAAMLRQAVLTRLDETSGRPLRVLEIGGGNGAVTRKLLPLLRGRNFHYTFSDLGKSLVLDMERWARAEGYDNVSACTFDATRPWAQQNVDTADFDVVIGLDIVHATPDVSHTVRNLASLLAPEGLLLLLESVNPPRFFDLLFGLADGWWSYTDTALRPRSPLLELAGWESVFRSAGLEATAFPQHSAARSSTDIGLVVGRKPSASLADSLAAIAAAGGEAVVEQADVTDEVAVRGVLDRVEGKFGRIDGVVHAAGEMHSGPLMARERPQIEQEFAAKIAGTRALEKALDGRSLDFLAFCSSVGAIAPGPGDAGYAAANAFMDAFAYARSEAGLRTISIGWDRWSSVGLARRLEALYRRRVGQPMPPGMNVDAALEAFEAVLSTAVPPHVVVARGWPGAEAAEVAPSNSPPLAALAQASTQRSVQAIRAVLHARPPLVVPYAEPLGDVEVRIAGVWREVLGVEGIGRNDGLTDLGGDSLIAIQIVARLREAFKVNVTVKSVFEDATISGLARTIDTLRWHAEGRPQEALAPDEEEGTL